jgi:YbbR domain-containing protein
MKSSKSVILKRLQQERWLLLLCFMLAFLGWQGIRKNIGFEVAVSNVTVDVDLPDGWAVWEKSIQHVNIVFRGSREDIRYLNSAQLRVIIPMSDPVAGQEIQIRLEEKFLKNPTGAKVVRFSPSHVFIRLDKESERLLPVKAAIEGSLPEGIEIERIVCTPAAVRVSGAEQILGEMQNIHTEPIRLNDRQTSFKESVPIALPPIGRVGVDPDWVSVEIMVEQHTSEEEFDGIPVRILCDSGEAREMELQPKSILIAVKGRAQRIEQMRPDDVFAYVDCTELTENTIYDLPVKINLPPGLQLVRTEPATVRVNVKN